MKHNRQHHFKGRWVYFVILAMVIQLMSGMGISAEATQEILVGGMRVTDIKIVLKNTQDEEVGSIERPVGSQVDIAYRLDLGNCNDLSTEQAIDIILPKELKLIKEENVSLIATTEDKGNLIVGECNLAKDGRGTIKFNNKLAAYTDAVVGFKVGVKVNLGKKPGESGHKYVEFQVGTKKIGCDLEFKGDDGTEEEVTSPTIEKVYKGIDEAKGIILWQIKVTAGNKELKEAMIKDSFNKNQISIQRIEVNKEEYKEYTLDEGEEQTTLNIKVPQLMPNETCTFDMTTKINHAIYSIDKQDVKIKNSAILEYMENNKLVTQASDAETTIKVAWITKTPLNEKEPVRQDIDGHGVYVKKIDWKVTVNVNKQDLAGWTFIDKIPKGVKLLSETVKLQCNEGDIETISNFNYDENASGIWNYQNADKTETISYKGILQYNFPEGEVNHNTYTFYYTTQIIDESVKNAGHKAWYYNKATLGKNGVDRYYDYTGVGFYVTAVKKWSIYHPQTHTITWNVIVNADNQSLQSATIRDPINEGITFKEDSVTIEGIKIGRGEAQKTQIGSNDYAYYNYDEEKKELECTITGDFNKSYIINFETVVDSKEEYAANTTNEGNVTKQYENIAYYTATSKDGNKIEEQASAHRNVTSQVLSKQVVNYDYATREATWLIVVNQNKMLMENLKLVDIIEREQTYVEDSFKLLKGKYTYEDGKYKIGNSSKSWNELINEAVDKPSLESAQNKQILTYVFPSSINEIYTVLLKTKITSPQAVFIPGKEEAKISNKVSIVSPSIVNGEVVIEAEKTINNSFILKAGHQVGKDEPIDWKIIINPNEVTIEDGIIIDEISEGLNLDMESIKLYKVIVKGPIEKVDQVTEKIITPFDPHNVSYNLKDNTFIFSFDKTINECYELDFSTFVTAIKPAEAYNNKAVIKGKTLEALEDSVESEEVKTQFSSSWGSATRKQGSIKVTKLNESNSLLKGAEITLLDSHKQVVKIAITDDQGTVYFQNIAYGTYYVKESKAPDGYVLDETLKMVQVQSNTQNEIILVNKNESDNKNETQNDDRSKTHTIPVYEKKEHKDIPSEEKTSQTTSSSIMKGNDSQKGNKEISIYEYEIPRKAEPKKSKILLNEEALPKTGDSCGYAGKEAFIALLGGLLICCSSNYYERRNKKKTNKRM